MKIRLCLEVDDATVAAFRQRYGIAPRGAVKQRIVGELEGVIAALFMDVRQEAEDDER